MKKLISAAAALLVFFAMTSLAFAERQEFSYVSVDVPDGWTAVEQEEGILIGADDRSAAITLSVYELEEGQTVKDVAEQAAATFGGQATEEDGGYYIEFTTQQGVEGIAFISGEDGVVSMATAIGQHPQLETILNSVEELE